jgi:hypothetical protein
MARNKPVFLAAAGAVVVSAALTVAGPVSAGAGAALSQGVALTNVPEANTASPGFAPASRLSPELTQIVLAQGSTRLENPSALTSYYGYDNDVLTPAGLPQMLPLPGSANEATKTEPDKNVYLVFKHGLPGADPSYDYGTHFLFQGHENGVNHDGYITRINLDADPGHRVTLLATTDVNGNPVKTIDGTTWDPWAKRLLFTTEFTGSPTYAATPGYPSAVTDVSGALGRGGYEGIQNDSVGDLWIVEDIGGATKTDAAGNPTTAKRPDSFIYRYVPHRPGDLNNGKLQALQVLNAAGQPITFDSQAALNNPDQVALHSYGHTFRTRWVTIHDTATDGHASFDAHAAAQAANATPFKRPENGVFQPGTGFKAFFFTETGDTNATSPENAAAGGWGGVMKITQQSPAASTGTISVFYKADEAHTGLDNCTFLSRDIVSFGEDAGDTIHEQRGTLDSAFLFDTTVNYAVAGSQPLRWIAEGRDPSATIDSAFDGFGKNFGDNEITATLVSDGDTSVSGILGAKVPNLSNPHWRWFYTQQHGDNTSYEVFLGRTRS